MPEAQHAVSSDARNLGDISYLLFRHKRKIVLSLV